MSALVLLFALAARPDDVDGDDLFRFEAGDVIERYDGPRFRVHFTRNGENAVPAADADASGIPDHVEQVAATYEEVADFYSGLGFRMPVDDGDGIFDVYLVDFNFSADGSFVQETCDGDVCAGYVVQENDFAGYPYPSTTYANRLLASHEFFHAIQAAYDVAQGAVIAEGTAVWGSDRFDDDLDDLELYSAAYLDETSRPITSDGSGPVDPFTYGSSIFWEFLAQKYGTETIPALYERCAQGDDPFWIDVIDDVLDGDSFADAWIEFAKWTVFTDARANANESFAQGAVLPPLTVERAQLPFAQPSYIVFVSSFRTLAVRPETRAFIEVNVTGDEENLVDVAVYVLEGNDVREIVRGATNEKLSIDARGATDVWIQLINTRKDGPASRPAICIGSERECAEQQPPPPLYESPPGAGCTCGDIGAAVCLPLLPLLRKARRDRSGKERQHGENSISGRASLRCRCSPSRSSCTISV